MHPKFRARLPGLFAFLSVALPVALSQPAVSIVAAAPMAAVLPGQSVTMSVSATGSPLAYQWRLGGADIPGATTAAYTLMFAGAADRGSYQAVVTGAGGSVTVEMGTMSVTPATPGSSTCQPGA